MEALALLEKKIVALVDLIKQQREQIVELSLQKEDLLTKSHMVEKAYAELQEQYLQLQQTAENLEASLLGGKEELDHEKELTKMVVDGLLKNIDSITQSEQ